MPVVAVSRSLTARFAGGPLALEELLQPVALGSSGRTELFIPDKYARSALSCGSREWEFARVGDYGGIWFEGQLSGRPKLSRGAGSASSPAWGTGVVGAEGSVYTCREGSNSLLASGIRLQVPVAEVGPGGIRVRGATGWAAYPGFVGDIYIAFLLMIFVPTLTLSVVKAIVDSARTVTGTARLFRYSFRFFAVSTLVAACLGIAAGYCCYLTGISESALNQFAASTPGARISARRIRSAPYPDATG